VFADILYTYLKGWILFAVCYGFACGSPMPNELTLGFGVIGNIISVWFRIDDSGFRWLMK
jgi:hypothetical protein